jgi:hypothetical protein
MEDQSSTGNNHKLPEMEPSMLLNTGQEENNHTNMLSGYRKLKKLMKCLM